MLDQKPIPRVLSRPLLMMGAEREPLMVAGLLCAGVAFSSMTVVGFVVCGAFWIAALTIFRWMAKADPHLLKVYIRHVRYKGYYPPFSRPYRKF